MRRVWMLLLAVIALVAVMTIPAMAAEETEAHTCLSGHCHECGSHDGWLPLDGKTGSQLVNNGKYYIAAEDGVLEQYFTFTANSLNGKEITICLNGKQWKGTDATKRAFAVSKSLKINIVDCSADTDNDGFSQGRITGGDIQNADPGRASSGGCISVYGGAKLNIYDGTIEGGIANLGGTIYMEDATISLYNGRIVGGYAVERDGATTSTGNGGNICMTNANSKFYMYGGKIIGGKTDVISDAEVTDKAKGAVIYVGAGLFDATSDGLKSIEAASDSESENGGLVTIDQEGAQFKAKKVNFIGGKTQNAGGALRVDSANTVELTECNIVAGYGGVGAAVFVGNDNCTVKLTDVNITAQSGKPQVNYGLIFVKKQGAKLEITRGSVDASNVKCGLGGTAIAVSNGDVTLTGTVIKGGEAPRGVAVYGLEDCGQVTFNNCEIYPGKSTSTKTGGAAVGIAKGSFTLNNTTIFNTTSGGTIAEAYRGVAIHMDTDADLVINGGKIYGGKAKERGGAIYMENTASSLTIKGGAEIIGGTAPLGGAICINSGTFTLENGTISGGTATEAGDNLYAPSKHAKIALLGGSVDGGVYMADANTNYEFPKLTLGGNIQICNTEKPNIYLGYRAASADKAAAWATIQIGDLKNTARIGITLQEEEVSKRVITTAGAADIATAQTWQSCIYSDNTAYSVGIAANNGLFITSGATGATLNGGNVYYELPAALAAAGLTLTETTPAGIVTMLEDYTGNVTVPNGAWLDLNGKTLTGNVDVQSGALYLLDSTTNDYNVADENGNLVYGKVVGTIIGTAPDSFTTGANNNYSGNHRYIVLQDADGTYHAHRIYLAVKKVVLYPQGPHMRYRTEFKCDQVVAKDAKYGVQISGIPYGKEKAEAVVAFYKAPVVGAGESNSRIAGLTNILVNEDKAIRNYLATMEYTACGYIDVNGQKFTSSEVKRTLKTLVEDVDELWAGNKAEVTETIKEALVEMYETYAEIMSDESWDIPKIKEAFAAKNQ